MKSHLEDTVLDLKLYTAYGYHNEISFDIQLSSKIFFPQSRQILYLSQTKKIPLQILHFFPKTTKNLRINSV